MMIAAWFLKAKIFALGEWYCCIGLALVNKQWTVNFGVLFVIHIVYIQEIHHT